MGVETSFFFWYKQAQYTFMAMMFGINSIIANHFEMFFGYMDDKLFDKFNSRNGFGNELVIFMTIVVKGDIFTIIIINS